MCGRYWLKGSPELDPIIEEMNQSPLIKRWQLESDITTAGEVRPSAVVPVIAPDKAGARAVFPMKWGFTARSLLINARIETASEKPTFAESWKRRRCIIPASWYFEWEHLTDAAGRKKTGSKYAIRPGEEKVTWLCGLYRVENGYPVFVVLTREPGESVRFIHDRMPLILPEHLVSEWIRPGTRPEELLPEALTDMAWEKAD